MLSFLLIIGGAVFLFGLVQWARSGAILWDLHQFLKRDIPLHASTNEKKSLQGIIREMEIKTDGLLKSSLKLVGVLGLCVWLFVIAFVVMGTDWSNKTTWANHVSGSPTTRAGFNSAPTTGARKYDALFAMGVNFRR